MNTSPSPEDSSGSRTHILVVEDEQDLQDLLRYNLTREGMQVTCAASGEQALKLARSLMPDLVLLDLMLPGVDGLTVCRTLKSDQETERLPILMLTAKGEEADIVVGLELGADDYMTKPFSPRVLMARIKAVLRRARETPLQNADAEPLLVAGSIRIDPSRHEVWAGDQRVDLTATEFRLLTMLVTRPGRVFTRQQIIETVHGGLAAVTDRSVDVQVVAIRRKLKEFGDCLQTVRGVGYRFKEDVTP